MVCGVRRAPCIDCCYGCDGCRDIYNPSIDIWYCERTADQCRGFNGVGTFWYFLSLPARFMFWLGWRKGHFLLLIYCWLLMRICLHIFEVLSPDMQGRRPALTSHNCFEMLGPLKPYCLRCLRTLLGHSDAVVDVDFAPSGSTVLTASKDREEMICHTIWRPSFVSQAFILDSRWSHAWEKLYGNMMKHVIPRTPHCSRFLGGWHGMHLDRGDGRVCCQIGRSHWSCSLTQVVFSWWWSPSIGSKLPL